MRRIELTDTEIRNILSIFEKQLKESRTTQDVITCTTRLSAEHTITAAEKPKIIFSTQAYLKMLCLTHGTTKEIAWHSTVKREGNTFNVLDTLCYPQEVTGTTVTTDDKLYSDWMMKLSNEEANSIRLQGHSHVNMQVTPSGVDTNYYQTLLQVLPADSFYIFIVMNKRNDMHVLLYDLQKNTLYETKDIEIVLPFEFPKSIMDLIINIIDAKDPKQMLVNLAKVLKLLKDLKLYEWFPQSIEEYITEYKPATVQRIYSNYDHGYDLERYYASLLVDDHKISPKNAKNNKKDKKEKKK